MPKARTPRREWGRHFEGWQLGVLSLTIAGVALALAMPRPAEPLILPLPARDFREETRELERDRERARRVVRAPLPFEVRAIGEAIRRVGRAELDAHVGGSAGEAHTLARLVPTVRTRFGDERLLELRALQTELFLAALRRWEQTGERDRELDELGGAILHRAEAFGWLARPHRLRLDERERRALFRMRWTELAGLRDAGPFAPSLDEWRSYYRCLLVHPQAPEADREAVSRARLVYVGALSKQDPEYPALLARGVLHFRLGEYASARGDLTAHLQAHPRGPWALRARNYLLGAAARERATLESAPFGD